jgi:nucleolar protein 9
MGDGRSSGEEDRKKDKGRQKKKKPKSGSRGDGAAVPSSSRPEQHQQQQPQQQQPRPSFRPAYSQVDPDTLSYLNEVGAHCASLAAQAAAAPAADGASRPLLEERALLAANVLEELLPPLPGSPAAEEDQGGDPAAPWTSSYPPDLLERALNAATDAQASRPLEAVLAGAPAAAAARFLGAFASSEDGGGALWRLCSSPAGSHVAERALLALDAGLKAEEEEDKEAAVSGEAEAEAEAATTTPATATAHASAEPVLDALARAVGDALNDYVYDRYATHVARRLLCVAAGRDVLPPRKAPGAAGAAGGGGDDLSPSSAGDPSAMPPLLPPPSAPSTAPTISGLAEKLRGDFAGAGGGTRALAAAQRPPCRFPALVRRLAGQLMSAGLGEDGAQLLAMARDPCSGAYAQAVLRAARCLPEDEGGPDLVRRLVPRLLGAPLSSIGGGEAAGEAAAEQEPPPTPQQQGADAAAAAAGDANTTKQPPVIAPKTPHLAGLREGHVGKLLRDPCVSRLAEAALAAAPPDLADEFYARFLQGRMIALASHHCANFAVQAALGASASKATVAAMHDELAPVLSDLLQRRRSGVAAALVAACARAGARQREAAAALRGALVGDTGGADEGGGGGGQGPPLAANAAMALMELDAPQHDPHQSSSNKRPPRLSAPGCATLATLLRGFPRGAAAAFVRDVACLPARDAVRAARDPSGSRALEAFFDSPRVPGAAKARLCLALCPSPASGGGGGGGGGGGWAGKSPAAACGWTQIATAPAGAFVVEAAFEGLAVAAAGADGGEQEGEKKGGRRRKRKHAGDAGDGGDDDGGGQDAAASSAPQAREALVAALADPAAYAAVERCRWGPRLLRLLGAEAYARSPDEWARRAAADARRRGEWGAVVLAAGGGGGGGGGVEEAGGGGQKESRRQKRRRKREEAIAAAGGGDKADAKGSDGSGDSEDGDKDEGGAAERLAPASGAEAGALALLTGEAAGGDAGGGGGGGGGARQGKKEKKRSKKESKA